MLNSFAARIAARFSPLDFTNVYGFPNTVPDIKIWEDVLPKFGGYVDDNPAQHLFEFHKLMDELNVHHEDVLMKLFMFSLERDARLWYKSLPHSSIPSLKEFHTTFHHRYERYFSQEFLLEHCCEEYISHDKVESSPASPFSDYCTSEDLIIPATNHMDQLSFSQMELQINEGNPQLSVLQMEGSCNNHEEHQEDYLSSSIPFVSDFDVKAVDDEEDSDIFQNLFQDQSVDFSMQKPSGFYSDFPVFDKYSDDEEDFKDLLSNEISSNPTYQLKDDQKSMNAMVEDRYESVVQESNEDPFNFDTSSKDIIVGEGDQKFFHDTYFQTQFSFDHYQDSNVGNEEHISSSLLKIVSCNRPAYHSDEFRSQGYDEGEKTSSNQQLIMHVSPTNIKQSTFNIQISKGNKQQHFSQLEQQQNEVFLCDFYDPVADYLESMSSIDVKTFLSNESRFCHLFELHFCMLWFTIFFGYGSKMISVNRFLIWLHWKHDFT
jgi:hypothetical protein